MISPHPHQKEAIKASIDCLKKSDRTHVVMACGTGKTLVGLWVAESLGAKTVLVFVPSLALISQIIKEWSWCSKFKTVDILAVCSNDKVKKEIDSFNINIEECCFPVTTQPDECRKFLKSRTGKTKWIFCTYQSFDVLSQASKGISFDLGVFDEAHRTASGGYFSLPVSNDNIEIKKRLFMTATPKHFSLGKKEDKEKSMVYSMDDESLYGKRAYTLSFRKAIELGLITDYKIIISVVSSPSVVTELNIQKAHAIALKKAIESTGVSKVICFNKSIKDAGNFNKHLSKSKDFKIFKTLHINGSLKSFDRSLIMNDFQQSEKSIITNARCLTEGIDIPSVDMVAFMSKKTSKIDIIQAIGRCIRNSPGKKFGYIFLPLFSLDSYDKNNSIEETEYRDIWDVVNALCEHDESLEVTIKSLKKDNQGISGGDNKELLDKYIDIVSEKSLKIESKLLRKLISTKIIDKVGYSVLNDKWEDNFKKLLEYKNKKGNILFYKENSTEENRNLCKWKDSQSMLIKSGEISENKKKLLLNSFEELLEDKSDLKFKINFDIFVSGSNSKRIKMWISRIKKNYKKGKLNDYKLNLLNSIKFDLNSRDFNDDKTFDKNFNKYKKFILNKKSLTKIDGKIQDWYRWLSNQRKLFKRNKLNDHRIKMLNSIGVCFNPEDKREKWNKRFQELNSKIKEGFSFKELDPELLKWLSKQRSYYKRKKLSKKSIELLNSIGFDLC